MTMGSQAKNFCGAVRSGSAGSDEIGIQRETKNEQVVLHQIVDRRTASMRSVGMLTNLNYEVMKTLLGERVMDCMVMNGGRWVNFNWESWRPNVSHSRVVK